MEYGLPNNLFFQYLQLRHAISAQSTITNLVLTTPTGLTHSIAIISEGADFFTIWFINVLDIQGYVTQL